MGSQDTLGLGVGMLRMNSTDSDGDLDAQIQAFVHAYSCCMCASLYMLNRCVITHHGQAKLQNIRRLQAELVSEPDAAVGAEPAAAPSAQLSGDTVSDTSCCIFCMHLQNIT